MDGRDDGFLGRRTSRELGISRLNRAGEGSFGLCCPLGRHLVKAPARAAVNDEQRTLSANLNNVRHLDRFDYLRLHGSPSVCR